MSEPESPLPSQLELVTGIMGLFGNRSAEVRHYNAIIKAANDILKEFGRAPVKVTEGMGFHRWMASDDTGMSSKYLACTLADAKFVDEFAYPHDPADFGRCYRMLRACPDLRDKMATMRLMRKPWPELYDAWEELERLWEEESPTSSAPKLYARIQQIHKLAGVL